MGFRSICALSTVFSSLLSSVLGLPVATAQPEALHLPLFPISHTHSFPGLSSAIGPLPHSENVATPQMSITFKTYSGETRCMKLHRIIFTGVRTVLLWQGRLGSSPDNLNLTVQHALFCLVCFFPCCPHFCCQESINTLDCL